MYQPRPSLVWNVLQPKLLHYKEFHVKHLNIEMNESNCTNYNKKDLAWGIESYREC
jgi:hypothetical protein